MVSARRGARSTSGPAAASPPLADGIASGANNWRTYILAWASGGVALTVSARARAALSRSGLTTGQRGAAPVSGATWRARGVVDAYGGGQAGEPLDGDDEAAARTRTRAIQF